jgi:hypothetical protein
MIKVLVVVGVVVLVLMVVGLLVVLKCCPNPLDVMDTERL